MLMSKRSGFALPTILIASVVMLMVLVTAITSVVASRTALGDQYYNRLAREAAESGLAMATKCLEAGGSVWTDDLRPGGDCAGLAAPCDGTDCYILNEDTIRTRFSVAPPTASGGASTIRAVGTVELVRKTSGTVWKTYTQDVKRMGSVTAPPATVTVAGNRMAANGTGYGGGCVIANDGWVYCTSNGSGWQAMPRGAIPAGATINDIVMNGDAPGVMCMIASNQGVYCIGTGMSGELGQGSTLAGGGFNAFALAPVGVALPGGVGAMHLSAGLKHVCAVGTNGKAYCWGDSSDGKLGFSGGSSWGTLPGEVSRGAMPVGSTVKYISAGSRHTCAIASNDEAYCWGAGENGRLGNNSTTGGAAPVAVHQGARPNLKVKQIVAGGSHSCAIVASTDRVYCWGAGGVLPVASTGDGTSNERRTPVAVLQGQMPASRTVSAIYANIGNMGSDLCAVSTDNGWLYCWGFWADISNTAPKVQSRGEVPAGVRVVGRVAGAFNSGRYAECILGSDGHVYCSGQMDVPTDGADPREVPFVGGLEAGPYKRATITPGGAIGDTSSGGSGPTPSAMGGIVF